jgi:hypothetical protein
MKQPIIISLHFYCILVMFFTLTTFFLQGYSCIDAQQKKDQEIANIYTTLRVIQKIHRDVEDHYDQLPPEDMAMQQDCMIEIISILVETYEKIVGTTVTYYLMMNMPMQQNLQQAIAVIIAQDTLKILHVLGKRLLQFITSQNMTWQQKAWYCTWVAGIIIIIKLGIDQLPQIEKKEKDSSQEKNSSATPILNSDFHKIQEDKSACLEGKFNNRK